MSQSDRSRKLFVRSVLAGTSTLATLMGAQSLAMIDNAPIDDEVAEAAVLQLMPTVATFPTTNAMPTDEEVAELEPTLEPTIMKVEPSITIFRQAGSSTTANNDEIATTNQQSPSIEVMSNTSDTNVVIQPPSPVELAAPDPIVIVEQPPAPQQIIQVQQPQQSQPQAQQQSSSNKSKSGSSR